MPTRIDVHLHYLPTFYLRALDIAGRLPPAGMPGTPTWSEDAALQVMGRLGIEKAYLSISSPGVHFGDDRAARDLVRRCNGGGARLSVLIPIASASLEGTAPRSHHPPRVANRHPCS